MSKIAIASALWGGLFCAAIAIDVSAAQAAYWVAPNGGGTACTEMKPCTASYAARNAAAGQTWYFKAGTYKLASPLTIDRSGTTAAPIVFSAAPGAERKAVLQGAGWKAVSKSHIRLNGFKIQNVGGDAIRFECTPRTVCDGIRIENNWTLNTRYSGIAVHGGLFQFDQYGTDNVTNLVISGNRVEKANTGGVTENISVSNGIKGAEIAHNEVVDGYNLGIDVKAGVRNVKIHHNTIVGHRGTSIYLDTNRRYVQDVDVYSNQITGGSGNAGIRLSREVWSPKKLRSDGPFMERVRIYNNVIDGVPGAAINLQRIKVDTVNVGAFRDITITNNTIVNTKNAIVVAKHPLMRNIVVRNNLAKTRGASYQFGIPVTASNNLSSDGSAGSAKAVPLFVDMAARNYRLKPGSPGIDHGTDADAPVFDFDDIARLQGRAFDMGAFER